MSIIKSPFAEGFRKNREPKQETQEPAVETQAPVDASAQPTPDVQVEKDDAPQEPQPNADPKPDAAQEPKPSEPAQPTEINDDAFLEFYKKKTGKEIKSFDDLLKEEKPTPASPQDEELAKIAKYKEKHGGTLQDYLSLQKDWSKVNDIDVLREAQKEESGLDLSNKEADALLKKKYGLDPSDDLSDLDEDDLLALRVDASKYKKEKTKSQEEILKSLEAEPEEKPEEEESQRSDRETVTLTNGQVVDKEQYLEARKKYEESRTKAVQELSETKFSFKFNDGDGEKTLDFGYQYTDEDKQGMLSASEDTSRIMQKFVDEETGEINHADFNEGLFWADKKNRESAIAKILTTAFSSGIEKQLREDRNINFDPKSRSTAPTATSNNQIDMSKLPGGFAPKRKFNKKSK